MADILQTRERAYAVIAANTSTVGIRAGGGAYPEVWARDAVITGLGAAGDPRLREHLARSLESLAGGQSRLGRIPNHVMCLETSGDGEVAPRACADHPGQRWVIENHWHNEGVMWRRLHPAHRLDLCLQQQADPRTATTRTAVRKCGPDWIQQWQLHD